MQVIEKFISPLIQEQFPDFYKEEGELFITFVKAYYEWLETSTQELELQNPDGFEVGDEVTQLEVKGKIIFKEGRTIIVEILNFDVFRCNVNCDSLEELVSSSGAKTLILTQNRFNPIYWARRLPEIRDIDRTIDRFILQFKNKYLPNVQFVTATNKELFIKNALDFYRAKGTERAIDLFFKLVYGFEANVFYPADDLFKLSDNEWADIKYLEIDYADTNINLVGNLIRGASSGAEAFAERLVRIKKDTRYINVLYITNLKGDFRTGEQIRTLGLDEDATAKVVGSLSTIEILSGSPGFVVGEDLIVTEGRGKGAKIRVTDTETFIGAVDFTLIDGGWGYSNDAEIIGSDRTLLLNEYVNSNNEFYQLFDTFKRFERVYQDLISYEIDSGAIPTTPFEVFGFDSSNTLVLEGTAVSFDNEDQRLVVNYDAQSNLHSNTDAILDAQELRFEVDGQELTANVANNAYLFSTSANVIASGNTYTFTYELANTDLNITPTTRLQVGDILTQNFEYNGVDRRVAEVIVTGSTANAQINEFSIDVTKRSGVIRNDEQFPPIVRKLTGDEYRIKRVSNTAVGVISVSGNSPKPEENLLYSGGLIYGVSPYWDYDSSSVEYERDGTQAVLVGSFTGLTPKATFEITERDNQFFIPNFSSNVQLTYSAANVVSFILEDVPYILESNVALQDATPIGVTSEANGDVIFEGVAIEYNETTQKLIVSYNNIVYPNTAFVESLDELIFDDDSGVSANVVSANHEYSSILNTIVASEEYGILPNPSLGFNDPLSVVGDFSDKTVSSLRFIVPTIPGSGYPVDPFYVVNEADAKPLEKYDIAIYYRESDKNFRVGETLDVFDFDGTTSSPTTPPTKVRIYEHDRVNRFIKARRLTLDDNLWISNNVKRDQLIQGQLSGVTAQVLYTRPLSREAGVGLNAIIDSPVFSGSGVISGVSIVSSGFGYFDEERMLFTSETDPSKTLNVIGRLGKQGVGEGFSRNRKSFLSSDKYLADNDFYQEYSYQVLTALPFSTYKQTLINVLHVAGTKPFGVYVATINNELEIQSDSDITQANT